jgi:hypothetical protein
LEYTHYVVLEKGVAFPIDQMDGEELVFERNENIKSNTPDAFYWWVMEFGGLGSDAQTYKTVEFYDYTWTP